MQSTAQLHTLAVSLLDEVFAHAGQRPIRLIGIGATNLVEDAVLLGFDNAGELRSERLDRAVDAIRDRFGDNALSRGTAGPIRR